MTWAVQHNRFFTTFARDMYRKLIKPLLFSLSIERAHRIVVLFLRIIGLIPGGRWLLHKCYAVEHPSLEREVFGIRFKNPVGLAAGFDRNGEAYRELAAMGFGFVEIGTVTPRSQPGNPRPRVFRLPKDRAIINRIGLANRGLEVTIRHLRRPHDGVIVGCNIGKNTSTLPENASADYLKVFRNLYQYVDYFTVNVSCPNVKDLTVLQDVGYLSGIVDHLLTLRRYYDDYRPILLKISPDIPYEHVDRIIDLALSSGLDGIIATNTTNSREGLSTDSEKVKAIGNGGLSGQPLYEKSLAMVRHIHEKTGGILPIIGVGGIMTPEQAKEMLDAGASLIQIYSGFIYNGPGAVRKILKYLKSHK